MLEDIYQTLLTKVNENKKCVLLTYMNFQNEFGGTIDKKIILTEDDIDKKSLPLHSDAYNSIYTCLNSGKLQTFNLDENRTILIEPFAKNPRLFIFGGGHISKPLSEFASRVGFSVTLIDDRPSFANKSRFPHAEKVICEDFKKSFTLINLQKSDYVVIITRGHRHDAAVLQNVLNHNLSYIGMIGSRRRVNAMKEEFISEGFSRDKLELVNAPIGLDIGAFTPDEIAISIVSQLISYKNKRTTNKFGDIYIAPEFDIEVIKKISENSLIPKALITILSTKGSVPRKAGAKMLAYLDGRTIGSIGGGCSESAVISKARTLMNNKGFLIEHVDMTGDIAASEGMVCGGLMKVLVEVL